MIALDELAEQSAIVGFDLEQVEWLQIGDRGLNQRLSIALIGNGDYARAASAGPTQRRKAQYALIA